MSIDAQLSPTPLRSRLPFAERVELRPAPARQGVDAIEAIEPSGGGVLTYSLDAIALCGAGFASGLVSVDLATFDRANTMFVPLMLLAWTYFGTWRRTHREFVRREFRNAVLSTTKSVFKALAFAALALAVYHGGVYIGPVVCGLFVVLAVGFLFAARVLMFTLARRVRGLAKRHHRVLVVGNNPRTAELLQSVADNPFLNVEIAGLLDDLGQENTANAIRSTEDLPIKSLDALDTFIAQREVDEVLITLPVRSCYTQIKAVLETCGEAGIQAQLLSNLFDVHAPRQEVRQLNGKPTLAFGSGPYLSFMFGLKRYLDCMGALVALTIVGLPMAIIAIAVKLTSKGPVLFRQKRCGLNGRVFSCLKFRTMVADAEQRKSGLQSQNEVSGPVFKMRADPRITPLGRFLRKYSLDELPQLLNVLVGDMSLVGPRPPLPSEVNDYDRWQLRRLSMRPGLTCIWQVSGRNNVEFEDWIQMDLKYIDNWSLLLDMVLLVRTIPAVVRGTGL